MPETKDIITEYIRRRVREGYGADEIAKALIDQGHPEKDVWDTVNEIEAERKPSVIITKVRAVSEKFPLARLNYIIITLLFLTILTTVIIYFTTSERISLVTPTKDCGYDKKCFIALADKCGRVAVKEEIAGSTIQYSTEGCVLKKMIVNFAEDEPIEIQTLLKDKTIECSYESGNFDEEFIEGILGGIDRCTGSLKDVIYELRIAQYMIT